MSNKLDKWASAHCAALPSINRNLINRCWNSIEIKVKKAHLKI